MVIDPTVNEQPALAYAASLAEQFGASLELFICDYDQYLAGDRFFDSASLGKARKSFLSRHLKRLKKMASAISSSKCKVSVDARWDHPLHEGIVRKVLDSKPDLVVKDTHYHSLIKRSIFSNTDWNLIRDCPVPMLLVKSQPIGEKISIIAAVDPVHERDKPAELDHEILSVAQLLTSTLGGELDVLHTFDPSPAYAVSADSMVFPIAAPMNDMMGVLKAQHEEAVQQLMNDYSIPDKNIHIHEGDTQELLNALVERLDASIVVMGAVARGPLKRLVLGSTAEQTLDRVSCNLLIVKPQDFETQVTA